MDDCIISRRNILQAAGLICGAASAMPLSARALTKGSYSARKPAGKLPLVMIDPGHGGKDSGAIGISGIYEKHVVSAIAQDLRAALIRCGHCRAGLTRHRDNFISLGDRVSIAQEKGASLMISLHADSFRSPKIRGASVYTRGKAPNDALTLAIERSENAADRFGHSRLRGVDSDVRNILSSMVGERTRRSSAHMAASVVRSFRGRTPLLDSPVRHAGFVVLKSQEIPSVLVEMGFLSNHQDEQALRSRLHRRILVEQLANAVNHYIVWQRAEGYSV